jgi:hypothetical protein
MATKAASSSSLPKSGAISKGYNFASTWEQSAPLTEQQQAAIVSLSHAVAERPFPANLVSLMLLVLDLVQNVFPFLWFDVSVSSWF